MEKFLCYALAYLLISPCTALAQWRLATGSAGIWISDIDIYYTNHNTMYALGGRLLISTDRGETWDTITPGFSSDVGAVKVDPFDSKTIYVSSFGFVPESNNINMTTDGGQTWQLLFIGFEHPSPVIEFDPVDLRTVYIGVGPGILFRTSNRGQSWDTIRPPPSAWGLVSLAISPSNNNVLYSGYETGIFKSTDRGNTWMELSLGFPIQFGALVVVHPQNPDTVYAGVFSTGSTPGGVYKSVNGGATWVEMNNGLTSGDWDIYAMTMNPANADDLFIGTGSVQNRILFRSMNAANNWTQFNDDLPDSGHVRSIIFDNTGDKVYAGVNAFNGDGIYINNDITSVIQHDPLILKSSRLLNNYPNPFNSKTVIIYEVMESSYVSLSIFDYLGRQVKTLVNDFKVLGVYRAELTTEGLPSGIYFLRLIAGKQVHVRKTLLLK